MDFIAHIRQCDGEIQIVEEHLLEVKKLAEWFGSKLGFTHLAGLAGMLHDMGKFTVKFREYILEAVKNPDSLPKRGSVDHSTAGGRLLFEYFHAPKGNPYKILLAEIIGNVIISHHAYLQDYLNPKLESNYLNRVQKKELNEFETSKCLFFEKVINEKEFLKYVDQAAKELEHFIVSVPQEEREKQIMFVTKFIFSTLIDADRTNTRLFEENKTYESIINTEELFHVFYERLLKQISAFSMHKNTRTPINVLRNKMSECCDLFAEKPSGIYTLSVPTGGGKTLASLRYALKHALLFNKKRIIYVVPFTTIIEQNADEVRKIIEDKRHVLEHHSNVVEDEEDDDEKQDGIMSTKQKLKLAKDSWDSPIIFTTMVQFLNVFYAKGNRNTRRLHNLSDSIIIFDEVQKVPVSCVSLFNEALNFLKTYAHCSILLCTATQPALDYVEHKLDINTDAEIVENLEDVIDSFKRVDIIDRATDEEFDNEKLCTFIEGKINEIQSVLVILNTKTVVRKLYNLLKNRELGIPLYHLSTSMCASHRKEMLEEIRELLNAGKRVICISTQLIEAGVDVSFDCVIRSLAGLDSIAQAAGRCNRHGEHERQFVYVIDHAEENLNYLKEIKVGKEIAKRIFIDLKLNEASHGGNVLSVQAIKRYFQEFFKAFETDLNYYIPKLGKQMTELLGADRANNDYYQAYRSKYKECLPLMLANSYKTAADHFHVIKDMTIAVIVPYKEGVEIITQLSSYQMIDDFSRLLRKAQQYTINLYQYELDTLMKNNGLVSYLDGQILALKEGAYNEEYGLDLENDSQHDVVIF